MGNWYHILLKNLKKKSLFYINKFIKQNQCYSLKSKYKMNVRQ